MYNYVNIQTNVYMPRCVKKTFHANSVRRLFEAVQGSAEVKPPEAMGFFRGDLWGTDDVDNLRICVKEPMKQVASGK